MFETASIYNVEPKLGEGIYVVKDVAKILRLDYGKTYRWMVGYWGLGGLDENIKYTFGELDNRAINFLSLIEFYTFFKLREKGISAIEIKRLHSTLSEVFNTKYPFAISQDFYIENRTRKDGIIARKAVYFTYLQSLIKHDKRNQFSLKFMEKFFQKVEFDANNLAVRFFPLDHSRNVVVDPNHQFGQPVINGTNIKVQTLFNLYRGGETIKDISEMYNLPKEKVKDAIAFQQAA